MDMIYVKIIDGTLYSTDENWYDVVMSPEEWDALDKSLAYEVVDKELKVAQSSIPLPPKEEQKLSPPPALEALYAQNNCGAVQQVEAMWDLVIYQKRDKADALEKVRKEVQETHKRLTGEYEASR